MMLQDERLLLGSRRSLPWARPPVLHYMTLADPCPSVGLTFPTCPRKRGVEWLGQELLSWYRLFFGREILTHSRTQMGLKKSSKGKRVVRNETKFTESTAQPAI